MLFSMKKVWAFLFLVICGAELRASGGEPVLLVYSSEISARAKFGIEKLESSLKTAGFTVTSSHQLKKVKNGWTITIAGLQSPLYKEALSGKIVTSLQDPGKEGFSIQSSGKSIFIGASDASGLLYGCLELTDRINDKRNIPAELSIQDKPEMVLRGACIGVQKPYYLPGRTVYEYPYTPETFPWFYDKQHWIQYLDSMVTNRMNSLYLWNGHPFASLVRVKDYPYAVEVDDATFKKNEEIYRFLTTEADKRGIWVIQMFYNIIVSKPFAEKHNIKTQERERPIVPLIADYTRKSIAAFVEKYPNVGLMVCLGEAMEGTGPDDIEWFTKTIIPGVQDGLKALGKKEEPPIVLRAHDTDAPSVMKAALPLYKNLYTEAKFNGEALTTPEPRGQWAELHQTLSRLGSVQIENVHILANLEPFRYGSADFIQRSVQGMHRIMGGNGLHLYPQASYWDWPYSADSVKGQRLLQIERDWIWYAAWSRYAWKADRSREKEIIFWSDRLALHFGCSPEQGRLILQAYEESGEIAPKLLRRFGITDGNRQTLTLGMLMTQLINPFRYGLFTLLYEGESPEGEMLIQYAEKEWKKQPHIGETPVQIIREVQEHGQKSVSAIDLAAIGVTKNKEEFQRLKNDMYCYRALAKHFAQKADAALHALRYKYSNDIADLDRSLPLLQQSVNSYKELVELTKGTYLYANSMQTQQRKIPIRGVNGTFKTWAEVLVPFEQELAHFTRSIDSLKKSAALTPVKVQPLRNEEVKIAGSPRFYVIDSLSQVFPDTASSLIDIAPALKGLKAIRLSSAIQFENGTSVQFTNNKPVKVLVGYFKFKQAAYSGRSKFLKAPELETNATANEYGQSEAKITNALVVKGFPPVNVHSYSFKPGTNTLKLEKGACLILGFISDDQLIKPYDAGITPDGVKTEIDWLFE
ncbi:hypothetical protein LZZ85_11030 [Terrimonas sp. NA20]|uniref:Beta-hexosaminidase bacterial type N-terminal domain-containing protein n=1 Tax=Terrimonas ginsenosidimutans TaxID=2908004 RepID=A0ABS9KRB0_9BACT|nr:hypothetical protein [Terrimonas ginsenosidimutans]MCG2614820.1 hypothetical protein [Terrimonas ginsenosidimutans]